VIQTIIVDGPLRRGQIKELATLITGSLFMLYNAYHMNVFNARLVILAAMGVLAVLAVGHASKFPFMERPTCNGQDTKVVVMQVARQYGLIRQARVPHVTSFDPNRENDLWYHIDHIRTRQDLSSAGAKICSARLTITHRGDVRITRNLVYAVGKDDLGRLAIALM